MKTLSYWFSFPSFSYIISYNESCEVLLKHRLITNSQFRILKIDALNQLIEFIYKRRNSRKQNHGVFLFALWRHLTQYNVKCSAMREIALELLRSDLSGRIKYVCLNGVNSTLKRHNNWCSSGKRIGTTVLPCLNKWPSILVWPFYFYPFCWWTPIVVSF